MFRVFRFFVTFLWKYIKNRHGFEKVLRFLLYAEIIFDELISVYVTQIRPSGDLYRSMRRAYRSKR